MTALKFITNQGKLIASGILLILLLILEERYAPEIWLGPLLFLAWILAVVPCQFILCWKFLQHPFASAALGILLSAGIVGGIVVLGVNLKFLAGLSL